MNKIANLLIRAFPRQIRWGLIFFTHTASTSITPWLNEHVWERAIRYPSSADELLNANLLSAFASIVVVVFYQWCDGVWDLARADRAEDDLPKSEEC